MVLKPEYKKQERKKELRETVNYLKDFGKDPCRTYVGDDEQNLDDIVKILGVEQYRKKLGVTNVEVKKSRILKIPKEVFIKYNNGKVGNIYDIPFIFALMDGIYGTHGP